MGKFILSIDQGTTSSRAILFDRNSNMIGMESRELNLIYPNEGWVEADPKEIWISVVDVVNAVMINNDTSWDDIDSIAITNQRETTVVWEKKTGKPVYNAIIWQSRQSLKICEELSSKKSFIHKKTGLIINPYFSASKIRFILDAIPNGQKRAENGELLFGTIDSWIIYNLTRKKKHYTDVSNASRTLLYNIVENKWDKELCDLFNIPMNMLPEVFSPSSDYGEASFFNVKTHIYGVAGDQQASLFGHNCFKTGECKNTYGTGCFMLMNIGNNPIFSNSGLLTTIAWELNGKITYALEGSVFIGGAAIQWLKNGLKIINNASDADIIASKVKDSDGVYFVPAFVGLGTPYWDDDVRGSVFGMTRATTDAHIVRATLEGIAYETKDVFSIMEKESKIAIKSLRVDGGATNSNILMQTQSNVLGINIQKPCCLETTALGAAYFAGLKSGFWKDIKEISKLHSYNKVYKPVMSSIERDEKYKRWQIAVNAARMFKVDK